jgi:hypothetical protein
MVIRLQLLPEALPKCSQGPTYTGKAREHFSKASAYRTSFVRIGLITVLVHNELLDNYTQALVIPAITHICLIDTNPTISSLFT